MDFVTLQLYLLLAFMVIGSLIAVEVRDLLSSIICVGAVGFAMAIAFLFLGAPDLAITQVVVEILALVILLRVVLTREDKTRERPKGTLTVAATAAVLGVLLAVAAFAMVGMNAFGDPLFGREGREPLSQVAAGESDLPAAEVADVEFGPATVRTPSEQYITSALPRGEGRPSGDTGASNYVMAILLDFRGYDTLGEATVIFVSIVGAYAVLRRTGRLKDESAVEKENHDG